jgi:hypothetical protein
MVLQEIEQRSLALQSVVFNHEQRDYVWDAHKLVKAASTLPIGRHVWLLDRPDITCIPMNIADE